MLVVLVEGHFPGHLLRGRIDLDRARRDAKRRAKESGVKLAEAQRTSSTSSILVALVPIDSVPGKDSCSPLAP